MPIDKDSKFGKFITNEITELCGILGVEMAQKIKDTNLESTLLWIQFVNNNKSGDANKDLAGKDLAAIINNKFYNFVSDNDHRVESIKKDPIEHWMITCGEMSADREDIAKFAKEAVGEWIKKPNTKISPDGVSKLVGHDKTPTV